MHNLALQGKGTATSLPLLDTNSSRQQILAYFNNTWNLTEQLFTALVNDNAFYARAPHKLRHPMLFYYAHPPSLYINKLRVAGLIDKAIMPQYEQLFETGVDEMRWDDLHEDKTDWPSVGEVRKYREQVYNIVRDLILNHPLLEKQHLPILPESPMWALVMAFEHERIHLETSSVLMRELSTELLQEPLNWPKTFIGKKSKAPANKMLKVKAGQVKLGKPHDWPSFGWDNEYGNEPRHYREFSASKFLISNAEFFEFVKSGGYTNEKFWSRDGWDWRQFRNVKFPTFWVQEGPSGLHQYKLRTNFEVVDMEWSWPAIVNYHEAKAYCAWKTEIENSATPYRLLTEAEHNAIRDNETDDPVMQPQNHKFNFNLKYGSENPVDELPANSKGFYDVFGNVWQWCEDHFHPLEGFKTHPYYMDFSVPCYDGKHYMILGGSFISTGEEASRFARFHFRPHFFQHAGFRIARSDDGNPASDAKIITSGSGVDYETSEMLNKYMLMHFGEDGQIFDKSFKITFPPVVNLPVKCAELVNKYAADKTSALDLGCAVGRASFELARNFKNVVGIDYSKDFIHAAEALRQNGKLQYQAKVSGDGKTSFTAKVDAAINRDNIRFEQGDASDLPLHLNNFDAVLISNVLCRLADPQACLNRLSGSNALVAKGGVLVMTTPFSWFENYTPKNKWIKDIEELQNCLPDFELLHSEELPFLIREHRRKFEYIITQASIWRRKQ